MTQIQEPQPPHHQPPAIGAHNPGEICVDFGKSVIRLRLREWFAVGLILVICFIAIPKIWELFEGTQSSLNDRIPYALSEDYWTYRARMKSAVAAKRIPIIGDSCVWGEYVSAGETLSEYLNSETGTPQFANAGLNGAHPLALSGLVENYTDDLSDKQVILHCNLLWMSSPDRDLQSKNDVAINHARLIPQFFPQIPAYNATFSQRLGIVIDRSVRLFDLISHVRTRYFDGRDLPSWSLANPYANPFSQFQQQLPDDSGKSRHASVSWEKQKIPRQDMAWVELGSSLQWEAWRRTALDLRSNRNRIFVVVGPFNEHILTEESRSRFVAARDSVEAWLRENGIASIVPAVLPSDEYGDASHPLNIGYARLAKTIADDQIFRKWLAISDSR